jgi:hypothetical protein
MAMRLRRIHFKYPAIVYLPLIVCIYVIFLRLCNGDLLPTSTAYYNRLIDAFLAHRYDIYPVSIYDLSYFHGKWYLYWGPSPVLFILPFYLIWKTGASDLLYGISAGIINVFLFTVTLDQCAEHFKIKLSRWHRAFLICCFAFISPNFFLAVGGSIWFINQIIAALYFLSFLLCYFLFLNRSNMLFLLISVGFFNLAWMARLSLIFYGILFLYPLLFLYKQSRKQAIVSLAVIGTISLFSLTLYGVYNYKRFGDFFDIGYKHQRAGPRFRKQFAEGKLFSPSYIQGNFYFYFVHPVAITTAKPYLKIDIEGNSIFFVYPWTMLLIYFIRKNTALKKHTLYLRVAMAALVINLLVILSNLGTGYKQFGSRYFFDLIPVLLLLLTFVIATVNKKIIYAIIIYGVIINLLGVYLYYTFFSKGI